MADRRLRIAPNNNTNPSGVITASGATLTASGAYTNTNAWDGVNKGWQNQAWDYYEIIGPLNYAINWQSSALSRVSLVIAEIQPGTEPEILETGPAVEILKQIKWDESTIMADLAVQLAVPGRGYLVGREIQPGIAQWVVYSSDQVRVMRDARRDGTIRYELREGSNAWIALEDALVVPVRDSDDRYRWLDTSTVKACLPILREILLYNSEITSTLVSRIANNGILLIPSEVAFPSRANQNDNEDPFVLELIEAAKQAIKDPGSASAAIPLPIRVPSQFIDSFRHLTLSDPVDANILEARKDAYIRLAEAMNLPKEIMTGIGGANHWGAWQIEESAIKTHISPIAELICGCLTHGFLYPQLTANAESTTGPNGGRIVVWYDTSALTLHPDLSQKAVELYDRVEISGDALRRETGFTEEDAPNDAQIREQLLKKAATNAQLALTAIAELTGNPQRVTPAPSVPPEPVRDGTESSPEEPIANSEGPPVRNPSGGVRAGSKKRVSVGTRSGGGA